jgi:hypothetical protein
MEDLIRKLTKELGVNREQARGGLVALLGGKSGPGRWAGLAASFTELGIDLGTAKKFGPIVIDYVREHGGADLVDKMRVALKI